MIPGLLLAVVCVLLLGTPAVALEVQVKDLHAPASVVTTTIELREVLPDRFKKTLDSGGILHLRVQEAPLPALRVPLVRIHAPEPPSRWPEPDGRSNPASWDGSGGV